MKNADTVINAGVLVTVDAANRVLPEHSLVVNDGKIIDLLPTEKAKTDYRQPRRWTDAAT